MSTDDYKIELAEFAGPLDLLLYLVRKEEVEIEALPLARITEQYLRFVESIPQVDLDRAGDFLVMAAQLLEWKARALLPVPRPESEEAEVRARSELVADLLEYRDLKERARLLETRADEAARRYGRTSPRTYEDVPTIKNVDLWDLVTAFQRIEKEIGSLLPERHIAEDEAPLAIFVERVRERLGEALASGATGVPFRSLFPEKPLRGELVATFLALLELIRLGEARARQAGTFGEIEIEALRRSS
ncbi:MAG TPA: segregation/condensation protein A [Planctomycetota bacterium]|nr:segregation/condensation protein A [Planctomycetota bacterium]